MGRKADRPFVKDGDVIISTAKRPDPSVILIRGREPFVFTIPEEMQTVEVELCNDLAKLYEKYVRKVDSHATRRK